MILDVVILVLPMPTLIKLNLSLGRKIGICLMFAVGILVTAVSIIRLIAVHNFDIRDNPTSAEKSIVNLATWSLIEVPLSITCVCMPGIRAFFYYMYKTLQNKASVYDDSPSSGRPSNVPSLAAVQSDTFRSANREQGDFIRLQEIEAVRPKTTSLTLCRLISGHDFDVWDNPTRDDIVRMASWSLVELPLSIKCVCMPGIWAFFHCTYKGLRKRYGGSNERPGDRVDFLRP
ncbi:uncharacterized protein BDV14DRAFT_202393 [Aspergillus stella-maris]|uniref:uncharacterized protein n=1 Tax=Aspergillus stella-maris TaxID=1810926 RepID=UPI003CCDA47F